MSLVGASGRIAPEEEIQTVHDSGNIDAAGRHDDANDQNTATPKWAHPSQKTNLGGSGKVVSTVRTVCPSSARASVCTAAPEIYHIAPALSAWTSFPLSICDLGRSIPTPGQNAPARLQVKTKWDIGSEFRAGGTSVDDAAIGKMVSASPLVEEPCSHGLVVAQGFDYLRPKLGLWWGSG